ncbi:hypothetical protein ABIB37_001751 [Agrococcus sp. UYP10]|uniref:hypothetical protein n=1 Tax=Agrococcus sp. UYP10 TaxID=1756355 RepID=UPI003398B85A
MRRVRQGSVAVVAIGVAVALLSGCTASPPTPLPTASPTASAQPTRAPAPSVEPDPSPSEGATAADPLDSSTWPTYVSERYGFSIGHPQDWSVVPAARGWTMDADAGVIDSPAQDGFLSPGGHAWVTAFVAPYEGEATHAGVQRWVEQHCAASMSTECAGIGERAEPLCSGTAHCAPGLLVSLAYDVQAFYLGRGPAPRMTAVMIWRAHSFHIAGLGSARETLDAFLATMDVHAIQTGSP